MTDEDFYKSQSTFNDLWEKIAPKNGSPVARASAMVTYETDNEVINKTTYVSQISFSNADNFRGGCIEFESGEFDLSKYHTGFNAKNQQYSYDGFSFTIEGFAHPSKNFKTYRVVLTDITVLE